MAHVEFIKLHAYAGDGRTEKTVFWDADQATGWHVVVFNGCNEHMVSLRCYSLLQISKSEHWLCFFSSQSAYSWLI